MYLLSYLSFSTDNFESVHLDTLTDANLSHCVSWTPNTDLKHNFWRGIDDYSLSWIIQLI